MEMTHRFHRYLAILVLLLLAAACNNGYQTGTDPFASTVKIDSMQEFACKSDSTQKYVLYLPANYDKNKQWPVVFAFDPHADGRLPLIKMREAASRFGYILAGSKNFRNGETNLNGIAASLFEDVKSRFSVDDKRVYLAGFSGGARAAASIALGGRGVRGLILSGAGIQGFSASNKAAGLVVYAMAGRSDFNMQETLTMEKELQSLGIPHFVSVFNGKHEWPPESELDKAFLWIGFQAMQAKLVPVDEKLVSWFARSTDSLAAHLLAKGDPLEALQKCKLAESSLQSLCSLKSIEKKADAVTGSEKYRSAMKNEEMYARMEQNLQAQYADAFSSQDEKWWSNELAALNNKCSTEKDPSRLGMYNRLKGFLGVAAYSFTSRAVSGGSLADAQKLVGIYRLIEPANPDVKYYQALIYDRDGKTAQAATLLKEAIKDGLGDRGRIPRDFSLTVQQAIH